MPSIEKFAFARRHGMRMAAAAALLVLAALIVLAAPHYSTLLFWHLRTLWPLLSVLVGAGALGMAAALFLSTRRLMAYLMCLGALAVLLGGAIWVFSWLPYQRAHAYAVAAYENADPLPATTPRTPYQVAVAQARPNLGDTSGEIVDTTYLPDREVFGTLVNRRGIFAGYSTVLEQHLPLTGRTSVQRCAFSPDAGDRAGGWLWHKLDRAVNGQQRGVHMAEADVYAYCDGDRPVVVAPLTRQSGLLVVIEHPAGVALYDGKNSLLRIVTDPAELATIPGPTYPLSLARKQREALTATGSWWQWVNRRTGFEDTADQSDDPNSGNTAEFTVAADLSDGRGPAYLTPLTGRGSATSISAVAVLPARQDGHNLGRLVIHRLDPPWVSTGAIAARIKADYQDIPNWPNLRIFEVAPTGPNRWVATIGNDQNVLYRVIGSGTLRDPVAQGSEAVTCLQRGDGSTVRCGAAVDSGDATPEVAQPPAGADPRTLTNEQLAELQRRIAEEISRRLTAGVRATPTR